MRKRDIFLICGVVLALLVLLLARCSPKDFTFHESVEEIEKIEIVSAESSLEYTVLKTLSEEEQDAFLEAFQKLRFGNFLYGDPITYRSGNYEMVCGRWLEYVKNGSAHLLFEYCKDKEDFEDLLADFLQETP